MAISLASLRTKTADSPPRVLVYGPPGFGKTSLGAEFPSPVFLQVEDGVPAGLEIQTFGLLKDFEEVMQALVSLADGDHDFQTVVLDSVDKLEPLVWDFTCRENNWPSIEAPGYGKGYAEADKAWREYLGLCAEIRNRRGMAIVHLAHSTIERFDDPQNASYSRYDIRLHKRAMALFQDEVDAILFINQDTTVKEEKTAFGAKEKKAKGGGNRIIYTEGRPSFVAKNRYGFPEQFQYKLGEGYAVLAPFLPMPSSPPVAQGAAAE